MNTRDNLLLNNQFLVTVGPLVYSFARVSNLTDSYELDTMLQGGSNRYPEFLPKQKGKAETLILERGLLKKNSLLSIGLNTGTAVREVIIMVLSHGRVSKAYFFEKGYVTKWEVSPLDAMGKDVLIKKLEITHSGLTEISIP